MDITRNFVTSALAIASAALLSQGCSDDLPAPLVWQARHVLVHPSEGGRVVEALWVRNGLSLIARHRTSHQIGSEDLLLDVGRQLVWLRDGRSLQALSLPELEPIAGLPLPAADGDAPLQMGADGAVVVDGERYRLANEAGGEGTIADAVAPAVVRDARRG